ncbi:DDE Tnp4 domain-containing protein [Mycena chlorophos]|uniref:DDE Tnp4 domain-containing protein n=1 Tax=Mycena chlorophos TaxID=658473 RepID=A0A8H6VQE1_MYCCL|nr:DDE Tnp4 domain-containing protein [Mycena chlorophos]
MAANIQDLLLLQMQELQDTASIVVHLVTCVAVLYSSNAYWSQPYHTSKLTGIAWVHELMGGHSERIHNEFGVHLHVFVSLLIELRSMGYGDSKHVTLEEQLAIFLYICRTGLGCRHVGERFQRSNDTITNPQTREELFNLRHAQARNIIERIFGVIKKRWRILVVPPSYDLKLQARVPAALAALHNFILDRDPEEHVDPTVVDDPTPGYRPYMDSIGTIATERYNAQESDDSIVLRDQIADEMWAQYQEYLERRGADMDEMELDNSDDDEEDRPDEEGYQSAMQDEADDL